MADKAISLKQFKEALKAIRNSTISEPDLSVRFVENAPNWNAAEGEPGYIQGRTHWSELGMVDIFKDLEVSELEEGAGQGMFPGSYDIEAGRKYIVTYNGAEYVCTSSYFAVEGMDVAVVIGNVDVVTGVGDSGEPFALMFVLPEMVEAMGVENIITFLDGSSSAVISLSGEEEIVHKLDPKFYDRMCGEDVYEKYVLTETEYSTEVGGSNEAYIFPIPFMLEAGKIYTVNYNGTDYACTSFFVPLSNSYFIGNGKALIETLPGNNEPFMITCAIDSDTNALQTEIFPLDENLKGTVSVKTTETNLEKLPTKFLPVPVGENEEEIVFAELKCNFNSLLGYSHDSFFMKPEIGSTCIVTVNGADYECIVSEQELVETKDLVIGDGSVFNGIEQREVPIAIQLLNHETSAQLGGFQTVVRWENDQFDGQEVYIKVHLPVGFKRKLPQQYLGNTAGRTLIIKSLNYFNHLRGETITSPEVYYPTISNADFTKSIMDGSLTSIVLLYYDADANTVRILTLKSLKIESIVDGMIEVARFKMNEDDEGGSYNVGYYNFGTKILVERRTT